MIKFVSIEVGLEFNNDKLDAKVRAIALLACAYVYYRFQEPLYITSIYRPEDTESAHGWWRAVDADNDAGLTFKEKQKVCDYINSLFVYDPERPEKVVCLYHTVKGRGGDHIHLQSHPNTTLRRH